MSDNQPVAEMLTSNELQSLQGQRAAPSGEPPFRFVQQCQDWFKEWLDANQHAFENSQVPANQVLMFIFAEAPEIERSQFSALEKQWKRFFAGVRDQNSQGVILSNENFRTMYRICPSLSSLEDAFQLIVDHLKATDTFAIAHPSQRRLLFHLPGGDIEGWCASPTGNVLRDSTQPLSAGRIEADIEQFHKDALLYAENPIAQQVWVGKQQPYKLYPNPEQRIQSYLYLELKASYKHLAGIVDEESRGKGGRCDIKVTWPSPAGSRFQPYTTTMLELKVLIEGAGATYHRAWALSGISQAYKYRRSDSEAVYTCVFDARKDQTDQMLDLDQVAKEKDVRLRRYLMEAPIDTKGLASNTSAATYAKKSSINKRVPKPVTKRATKKIGLPK